MKQKKVEWPNVLLPGGFDSSRKLFNFDGYGLIVVDGKGVVRAVNVPGKRLAAVLNESFSK